MKELPPIDFSPVPDLKYLHGSAVIIDGKNDPVVPLPDPIALLR
jgi:hypothetical protein